MGAPIPIAAHEITTICHMKVRIINVSYMHPAASITPGGKEQRNPGTYVFRQRMPSFIRQTKENKQNLLGKISTYNHAVKALVTPYRGGEKEDGEQSSMVKKTIKRIYLTNAVWNGRHSSTILHSPVYLQHDGACSTNKKYITSFVTLDLTAFQYNDQKGGIWRYLCTVVAFAICLKLGSSWVLHGELPQST